MKYNISNMKYKIGIRIVRKKIKLESNLVEIQNLVLNRLINYD